MLEVMKLGEIPEERIFSRSRPTLDVSGTVAEIIQNVRENGDSALRYYADKFDGGAPESFEATQEEIDAAFEAVGDDFLSVLRRAAHNIEEFHREQTRHGFEIKRGGRIMGQRVLPLSKVGVYIPGGTASLCSTVLMDVIPARIAGCGEIIMATPAKNGVVAPEMLAAAKIGGATKVLKTGGAQVVAALAYGTESVPAVDKIVGPGNAYVQEAKRQVFGKVDIDMICGPSEILVIADSTANPVLVAADMLSQAEHDVNASAVLVTTSIELARAVAEEVERQIPELPRADIARRSIDRNGKIIVAPNVESAIETANRIAPEHLELTVAEPFEYLDSIKNAGSVFLGADTPEAVGDYYAGCNHTLPTEGAARFSSPLSVDDFIKTSQYMYYSHNALLEDAEDIAKFAEREGLAGHARSIIKRTEL